MTFLPVWAPCKKLKHRYILDILVTLKSKINYLYNMYSKVPYFVSSAVILIFIKEIFVVQVLIITCIKV